MVQSKILCLFCTRSCSVYEKVKLKQHDFRNCISSIDFSLGKIGSEAPIVCAVSNTFNHNRLKSMSNKFQSNVTMLSILN